MRFRRKSPCTCKPVTMHDIGCPVVSPHGVCPFCKESIDANDRCSCWWENPAPVVARPAPQTEGERDGE